MQQHAGALQMLQEANAQARAIGGAFDQPRDIRHHESCARAHRHHAQIRMQRGERIIGHFGSRRRHGANQRGLAGIGQPEQSHIGDQLQFQLQLALLSRQPKPALRGVRLVLDLKRVLPQPPLPPLATSKV
jgi:hypothetical protein